MKFQVSIFRFLINESFVSVLISTIATILDLQIYGYPYICVYFWLCSFLLFCLKIDLYGRDQIYIKDKYIRLERTKVGGNAMESRSLERLF